MARSSACQTIYTDRERAPSDYSRRIAQILKSVSTQKLFEFFPLPETEYWGREIWVAGYFVWSVGPGLTKEQIERYGESNPWSIRNHQAPLLGNGDSDALDVK